MKTISPLISHHRSELKAEAKLDRHLLTGAIFMVVADIVSRIIATQQTVPIGVVTALVGVPFFAIILYRARPQA